MPKFILVVDDSEIVRIAVRQFVEAQTDFRICGEAVDGMDALEKVDNLRPDLIILDLTMPRMDGFQTARQLRARRIDVPVVLFTVSAELIKPEQANEAGVTAVVAKEEFGDLRNCIEALLAT